MEWRILVWTVGIVAAVAVIAWMDWSLTEEEQDDA